MSRIANVGQRLWTLISKGSEPTQLGAGTRLIEEVVELALEMGCESASIYDAVGNTLHKEANKTGIYPSKLFRPRAPLEDVKEELGDVMMNLLYCIHLNGFTLEEIQNAAEDKITLLEHLQKNNKIAYKLTGKIYRIKDSNVE